MNSGPQEVQQMMEQESMERAITSALERQPQVVVPEQFAAKVAQALPGGVASRAGLALKARSVARSVALVAAVLLAGTLFILAPHAADPSFSNLAFDLELLVLAELGAVAWVLGRMQAGRL
jgi:hypothetical protein